MLPQALILGLSLAQKKQQQNQADNQRIMNSMQTPQAPTLNADNLLGNTNFGQQNPQQTNMFETEDEKRKRLGFFG